MSTHSPLLYRLKMIGAWLHDMWHDIKIKDWHFAWMKFKTVVRWATWRIK